MREMRALPSAPIAEAGVAMLPALVKREGLGAAVDIGSTTIVARVYDLATGELLRQASAFNPQRRIAADVMGRISAAMSGRLDELRDDVRTAVRMSVPCSSRRRRCSRDSIRSLPRRVHRSSPSRASRLRVG